MVVEIDRTDQKILEVIQHDGRITNQQLAQQINLSNAPCWRRLRKLEDSGVIDRYVAILNPDVVGLNAMAIIQFSLTDHSDDCISEVDQFIAESDEIVDCYTLTGATDYMIRVIGRDILSIEQFIMKKLLALGSIKSTNSSFILRQKKYTTALPVKHL